MTDTKRMNLWKTSDISIRKDREGFYDASHKYQGDLIVTGFYSSRAECRQDAVKELKNKKEENNS